MTLFMVLLAAFQALLHRVTGQTDVVVATDVANRERRETEGLIGLFLNQVVLRTDLSGEPAFEELLERVRSATLEAFVHQSLPFETLVRELEPERELRYPPIAQIKLNLQNLPGGIHQGSGLEPSGDGHAAAAEEPASIAANLDLTAFLSEEEDGLRGTFVYAADLYDAEQMRGFAADYGRVLEEMLRDFEGRSHPVATPPIGPVAVATGGEGARP